MSRTSIIASLAVLSSILTPVVVKATGTTPAAPAVVQQAKVEKAVLTTPATAEQSPCVRKVKVVYAAYGEVHAAACASTAEICR